MASSHASQPELQSEKSQVISEEMEEYRFDLNNPEDLYRLAMAETIPISKEEVTAAKSMAAAYLEEQKSQDIPLSDDQLAMAETLDPLASEAVAQTAQEVLREIRDAKPEKRPAEFEVKPHGFPAVSLQHTEEVHTGIPSWMLALIIVLSVAILSAIGAIFWIIFQ